MLKRDEPMTALDFVPEEYTVSLEEGSSSWQAPSNIALIKYWGKTGQQIPANPSLSFTLQASVSRTTVEFRRRKEQDSGFSFDVFLDGVMEDSFRPKILYFFTKVSEYLPFLEQFHFTIKTHNSFPHSSGIASSASGMAALALCLTDIERQYKPQMDGQEFLRKASFIARLGSGSASRSLEGPLVLWGQAQGIEGSSDLYGVRYPLKVHKRFENYQDTILLVDRGRKTVSSTVGHGLMQGHPFAEARFAQARQNLVLLQKAFAAGDLEKFAEIVETEALSLHSMMMSSSPSYILMKPNTLEIIERLWEFRKRTGLPACFTLDAGANVHLLYPQDIKEQVLGFIKNELIDLCEDRQYICDQIGFGAEKM